ncbi:MAG: cell division protein FtsX [Pseudobdellovibrionaceae bacterium]
MKKIFGFSEMIPYLLLFACTLSALFILVLIKTSRQSISQWSATQEISIFASADLSEDEKNVLTQTISSESPSSQIEHYDQAKTKKMMVAELGLMTEPNEAYIDDLIPNLFLVRGMFSDRDVSNLVAKLKSLGGVEDIQWGSSWTQKLRPLIGLFTHLAWVTFGAIFLFFYLLVSYLVLEMMKKDQKKYLVMSFLGATSFQIEKLVFKKLVLFLSVCLFSSFILLWVSVDLVKSYTMSTLVMLSGFQLQMLSVSELMLFLSFAFLVAFLSAKKSLTR